MIITSLNLELGGLQSEKLGNIINGKHILGK